MKFVILESRREDLTFKYLMDELGEFIETPNSDQIGVYKKNGSGTGKIVSSIQYDKLLLINPVLRKQVMNLFSLDRYQLRNLIQDKMGIRLLL